MRTLMLWVLHITSLLSTFIMWWGILSIVVVEFLNKTLCHVPLIKNVLDKKFFKWFCVIIIFFALVCCCQVSSPYQNLIYRQIE